VSKLVSETANSNWFVIAKAGSTLLEDDHLDRFDRIQIAQSTLEGHG